MISRKYLLEEDLLIPVISMLSILRLNTFDVVMRWLSETVESLKFMF